MNRPLLTFTRGSRTIYVVSSCFECKGKELFLYRKGLKEEVRKKNRRHLACDFREKKLRRDVMKLRKNKF